MARSHFFFKVEIEHAPDENLDKLGGELERLLRRFYGVESVELASVTRVED